ncbi:helix-turn-helix domain-containing protein [Streptomyces sp. LUP47B]|uniref:helix-turn-helix domain-containing protein n=1 Tax=Streptomyces sp. LUP47B TaxID=1890286 RepID=UPI00085175B7|nr:helix-turn-helix transcriptional regulator [Streptomyces sp. LUP47B]
MARNFSGRRLREARKSAGISPEQLAVSVGRSAYSIHEYEMGRVTPSVTVLAAIADTLGRPVDDLLTEAELTGRAA